MISLVTSETASLTFDTYGGGSIKIDKDHILYMEHFPNANEGAGEYTLRLVNDRIKNLPITEKNDSVYKDY